MNDYHKNLPRKWMGAGILFFNKEGKFIIVKPTYKDYWEIPGGCIDKDESPWNACKREVKEELGLDIDSARLLTVDYLANTDDKGDRLMFIFDGGLISETEVSNIVLQKEELSEYRFVSLEEAVEMLGNRLKVRIVPTVEARMSNSFFYLENGRKI